MADHDQEQLRANRQRDALEVYWVLLGFLVLAAIGSFLFAAFAGGDDSGANIAQAPLGWRIFAGSIVGMIIVIIQIVRIKY